MKTEARYAIDGKTHYSVMKEIPVPKELKGLVTKSFIMAIAFINDFYKRERGYYYFGNVKQVAFELSPVGCLAPDNTKVEFIKWYSTEKRALNAAKKIAKKCAYVVGYQAVEWGEKIDVNKWIAI